jgi:hypothetical protein
MKNYALIPRALTIPVLINTLIFLLLSMLHFYWSFGGELWYDEVLPTSSNGLHKLTPGPAAALVVSFGLLCFAIVTAGNLGLFNRYMKMVYFRYGVLTIAVVFALRAVGDFKFIGFFKTVQSTKFALNDTIFFSPLCLFISLLSVLIFIFSKHRREYRETVNRQVRLEKSPDTNQPLFKNGI